jgi:hypothetical protein
VPLWKHRIKYVNIRSSVVVSTSSLYSDLSSDNEIPCVIASFRLIVDCAVDLFLSCHEILHFSSFVEDSCTLPTAISFTPPLPQTTLIDTLVTAVLHLLPTLENSKTVFLPACKERDRIIVHCHAPQYPIQLLCSVLHYNFLNSTIHTPHFFHLPSTPISSL